MRKESSEDLESPVRRASEPETTVSGGEDKGLRLSCAIYCLRDCISQLGKHYKLNEAEGSKCQVPSYQFFEEINFEEVWEEGIYFTKYYNEIHD